MAEVAPAANVLNSACAARAERPRNFTTLLAWTARAGVVLVKL
jgi:hypothetical protein